MLGRGGSKELPLVQESTCRRRGERLYKEKSMQRPIVGVEAQASGLPVIFSDTITREAKITQAVSYLGIDARDVSKWLDTIIHYGKEKRDRIKAYDILKNAKFDIVDTVNGFMKLYRG